MSSKFPYLTRNDPLGQSKRYRSGMPGDARFFGLDSAGAIRKYNGNLATGATTLYTCPSWKRAISPGGLYFIHNPTGGSISFDFHHVPSGGSVNNNNRIATLTVAANESRHVLSWYTLHVLMPGDSLVINPGTLGLNAWGMFHEILSDAAAFIGGAVNNIAATTETTAVTCPATRTLVVASIVGHNYNAGTPDVSAHARESGVAAGASNQIFKQAAVATSGEFEAWPAIGKIAPQIAVGEGGVISVLSTLTNVNFWVNAFVL